MDSRWLVGICLAGCAAGEPRVVVTPTGQTSSSAQVSSLQQRLLRHRAQLERCFEPQVARDPGNRTRRAVLLTLVGSPGDGAYVHDLRPENAATVVDTAFQSCVRELVSDLELRGLDAPISLRLQVAPHEPEHRRAPTNTRLVRSEGGRTKFHPQE